MNKTQIEWVKNPDGSQGYTWNPITGCLNHVNGLCKGGDFPCYAYKLAHGRLKQRYLANLDTAADMNDLPLNIMQHQVRAEVDPFYPRFWEEKLVKFSLLPNYEGRFNSAVRSALIESKRKGIFVCDMSDLFGIGVPKEWTKAILEHCRWNKQHRFYLLTKQPQRLPEFSPFPDNAWIGVTATNTDMLLNAINCLEEVKEQVKYISLEPLLSWADTSKWVYPLSDSLKGLSWLILGACTGTLLEVNRLTDTISAMDRVKPYTKNIWTLQPKIEWVREIVEAADKAGIKVFLKDNLRPLLIPEDCSKPNYLTEDIFWASDKAQLRQEMPE